MSEQSWTTAPTKNIDAREYIKPGIHQNDNLYDDMEAERKAGFNIYVIGTDGETTVAFGVPDNDYEGFYADWPWNNCNPYGPIYFKTARDCMQRTNGTPDPKASALYRTKHRQGG